MMGVRLVVTLVLTGKDTVLVEDTDGSLLGDVTILVKLGNSVVNGGNSVDTPDTNGDVGDGTSTDVSYDEGNTVDNTIDEGSNSTVEVDSTGSMLLEGDVKMFVEIDSGLRVIKVSGNAIVVVAGITREVALQLDGDELESSGNRVVGNCTKLRVWPEDGVIVTRLTIGLVGDDFTGEGDDDGGIILEEILVSDAKMGSEDSKRDVSVSVAVGSSMISLELKVGIINTEDDEISAGSDKDTLDDNDSAILILGDNESAILILGDNDSAILSLENCPLVSDTPRVSSIDSTMLDGDMIGVLVMLCSGCLDSKVGSTDGRIVSICVSNSVSISKVEL